MDFLWFRFIDHLLSIPLFVFISFTAVTVFIVVHFHPYKIKNKGAIWPFISLSPEELISSRRHSRKNHSAWVLFSYDLLLCFFWPAAPMLLLTSHSHQSSVHTPPPLVDYLDAWPFKLSVFLTFPHTLGSASAWSSLCSPSACFCNLEPVLLK